MAKSTRILRETILELLASESEGLEVKEILAPLRGSLRDRLDSEVSDRGVRNLLNKLVKEGKLIKKQQEKSEGRGKPPYIYFHQNKKELLSKSEDSRQLTLFDDCSEVKSYNLETSAQVAQTQLDSDEKERQNRSLTVLETIAANHLEQDDFAKAIIENASELAQQNPVDLIIDMAVWVVEDLNNLADDLQQKWEKQDIEAVKKLTSRLEQRLIWTKNYFQRFWRLDRRVNDNPWVLDLPRQARDFFQNKKRANLNEEEARERLKQRIFGESLIEEKILQPNKHKAAVGTDASIADISLNHTPGSFIPPDPVVVTNSAAAMIANNSDKAEYQDFDIFPDRLQEYEPYPAAREGLILSPALEPYIGRENFKRSRIAAMELRQYSEDFRVATQTDIDWRPIGDISKSLGINSRPTLIFRDGRLFPIIHNLNFYETEGLYGDIVRNQIQKFVDVIHNTLCSPNGEITYVGTVKNPEISWLSPLVFWYLYKHRLRLQGKVIIDADNVYKAPFTDTIVSHLLFLGVAKQTKNFAPDLVFITCRVLRRFSDIALRDTSLPPVISENDNKRVVNEDDRDDWDSFILQRIKRKEEMEETNILDFDGYNPFLYLCNTFGVLMCYCAPTLAYKSLASGIADGGGHFLIPRLEVAVSLERKESSYSKNVDKMLSWLTPDNWELDSRHTQSGFDRGKIKRNFPILIPNVVRLADEVVTFARDKLSDEVEEALRSLIAELRRRMEKKR